MGQLRQIRQTPFPEQQLQGRIEAMPDEQVICRGLHRHDWPSDAWNPRKVKNPPKGMDVSFDGDGVLVTDTCKRGCGRVRYKQLTSGALYDPDARVTYGNVDDRDWEVFRQDDGLTPRPCDFRIDASRRQADAILHLARARKHPAAVEFKAGVS